MWWSIPNWSRLLPVLGGAMLAPMVLVPVPTPPSSEHTPDIAFAPASPVAPASPTTPPAPAGQVAVAGHATPIAPSPFPTTATRLPATTGTTPAGSTTAAPPPEPATPAAVPQPRLNDDPTPSVHSGPSCPDLTAYLDSALGTCTVARELSVNGTNA